MRNPLRHVTRRRSRLLVGVLFVGLSASGFAFGNVAGSSVTSPQPGGLDHFLCYPGRLAKGGFANEAVAVDLQNQFAPNGMLGVPGAFQLHCNPTQKTLASGVVTPITNPDGHLVCFGLKTNPVGAASQSFRVIVTNQFGQGLFVTGPAVSLCVPSWKNLQSPTAFPPPDAPPGLDHFTCYRVSQPAGAPPFPVPTGVTVQDQFGKTPVVIGQPALLCVPTIKIVDPAVVPPPPLVNPTAHLLCFTVTGTRVKMPRPIFDKNQFGIGQPKLKQARLMCLPSFKDIAPGG